MTHGDADAEKHKLWCAGELAPGEHSPLLARDELLAEVGRMMEAWREHNSEGTDMCGLTPHAVFIQYSPPGGFPRISDDELAFATAQHFENEHIETGGIVELRDGSRYSHPLLVPLAGEKREVVRLRHDHSFVTVLAACKGEENIIAPRRVRVGTKEPDELARQMELQSRVRKLAGAMVKPLEYNPGAEFAEAGSQAPRATQVIRPSEFIAANHEPSPESMREIGSVQFMMERDRYKKRAKPLDFADLEE
jgi:hypothetical protein